MVETEEGLAEIQRVVNHFEDCALAAADHDAPRVEAHVDVAKRPLSAGLISVFRRAVSVVMGESCHL